MDDITAQHEGVVEGCESIQTGLEERVKLNMVRDYKCIQMLCKCYLPLLRKAAKTDVTLYVSFPRSWNLK